MRAMLLRHLLSGCHAYGSRKSSDGLHFGGQRTDDIDIRQVHRHAQLLETELDVPARDERADQNTSRRRHDARRNGLGDAQRSKQAA